MVYHRHTFLTTQGHGEPPRMSDQPDAGATSETAQTWKTIHTKHTPIHTNKANMDWWLRRPNDIRVPCGPKVSRHSSYRWGKTPKKPHPENLSRPGIEPGPAAWQARMLPLAPQRWTTACLQDKSKISILETAFHDVSSPPSTAYLEDKTKISTLETAFHDMNSPHSKQIY